MQSKKKTTPKGRLAATTTGPLVLFALASGLLAGLSGYAARPAQVAQVTVGAPLAPAGPPSNTPGPGVTATTAAASGAPITDGGIQKPAAPGNFDSVFHLSDIGVADTIVLRGVDAYHSVFFSLPQTEAVKTAKMHIKYHFSPGLLPDISHLKVSLNGTLFATLPVTHQPISVGNEGNDLTPEQKVAESQVLNVTRNETNALLEMDLTLPAELLVHQNELTFEFIGHYTYQCEDPSHSTLWSHVDADSTIEIAGSLIPLNDDLSILPLPFYDAAVNLHPSIPMVFLNDHPSAKALRAAGIIASYFGILTDYHAARFPVSMSKIPTGNAIVLGESAADLPAALNVTGSTGATIAMRSNPVDPYSKILVLTGDNGDDLVTAAEAFVLQTATLQGRQVSTAVRTQPNARVPDDAPRWMSTEHRTTLGDISNGADLQGDGSVPIGSYLRLPPDLYQGTLQNLNLHMEYRYDGIPLANESSIQVYMNGGYVSSTPLPHTENSSSKLQTVVPVPFVNLRPFSNSLMMKFVFQIAKKGKCQDTYPGNLQGAILKTSYLDIQGLPHWATLPNLELFANAGYPFTRLADLAETTVVLPDNPTASELELYLALMGHFGAQTGYPVLNVTVTNPGGMKSDSKKDYIVMGTVGDIPDAVQALNPALPVQIDASAGLHVQDTQGFFAPLQRAWWKVRSSDHVNSGTLETEGGMPAALVQGLEWPRGSHRSVVLITLRNQDVVPDFVNAFLKESQSSRISQSVSVLHGSGKDSTFVSYQLGSNVYHVGDLSWLIQLKLIFSEFPWLMPLVVIFFCILMAALIRAFLRRRARTRLQGNE